MARGRETHDILSAQEARFYILQTLGPVAFILQSPDSSLKFKVCLGAKNTCSCHQALCIHLLWILIKFFHVDAKDEILYKDGLLDREVEELLNRRDRVIDN